MKHQRAPDPQSASSNEIQELVRLHYEGMQGTYFDELVDHSGYSLLFSELISDSYYNYVAASPATTLGDCLGRASEFADRQRNLAVYLPFASPLGEQLGDAGFTQWATEAWLTTEVDASGHAPIEGEISTRIVDGGDDEDVAAYIAAFESSFSGADPSDPYGALDESYSVARERAVRSDGNARWPSLFIVATDSSASADSSAPVGVAQLVLCGEWAGVYGVGTVPSARRRGVSRVLMARLTDEARVHGARRMFLQTAFDSSAQRVYEAMGFSVAFVSTYFVAEGASHGGGS